ncbi:MAG: SIS domain-containing protein [Planctomycetes bacterium]|nr:SIS domain-containing protein [Planctomycetota bacterium]
MAKQLLQNYLSQLKEVIDSLALEKVTHIIDLMTQAYNDSQQIFIFGNGGSGSTASHFACDINKGVCLGLKKRFKVMCLNDNIPSILAYANDNSYDDIFVEQLKNFLAPNDLVIALSGSGNSANVLKAIQFSNKNHAHSIAFTGFDGGELAKTANHAIVVPVDDMQKVEDMHLVLTHMIMQILCDRLK